MALITTIIPTFRRPRLLSRAIKSSLNQTFTDLQIQVLDNASGDETADVVKTLAAADPRGLYHCHSENLGGMRNFQYGLEHVQTPFFSLLSDDDILLPQFYATAMQVFTRNPQVSFVACGTLHITPGGDYYGMPVARLPPGVHVPPEGLLAILRHGHPEWTAIVFRQSILRDIGFLDPRTGHASDLDFELRAAAKVSFFVSHIPGAIYSTQPLTPRKSGTYPFDAIWPSWPRMIENLTSDPDISDSIRNEAQRILEKQFNNGLFSLSFRYLYQDKIEDARKAQEVLRDNFKSKWRSSVLSIAIILHQALGPTYSFKWWDFCRKVLHQMKSFNHLKKGRLIDGPTLAEILPYVNLLKFLN